MKRILKYISKVVVLICILIVPIILLISCHEDSELQIELKEGLIEGKFHTASNVIQYLGVPYAKPPIGNLRWRMPEPNTAWKGVKKATDFAPSAMQLNLGQGYNKFETATAEDCLYLNLWTPKIKPDNLMPVLVILHGGGFTSGSGAQENINGNNMASLGTVVITVNYRLNVFGFFTHPQLVTESNQDLAGNYGLYDQLLALQWIRNNVERFGGNPENITLSGNSAGAMAINAHICSELSQNLFSKVIVSSGSLTWKQPHMFSKMIRDSTVFSRLGYNNIEALRKLPADSLLGLYREMKNPFLFGPIVDGYLIKDQLISEYDAKACFDIPMIIGYTSHEISGKGYMKDTDYTEEAFESLARKKFKKHHPEVLSIFPHSTAEEIELSSTEIASLLFQTFNTWKWYSLQKNINSENLYLYVFSKHIAYSKDDSLNYNFEDHHVRGPHHSSDVPYALNNLGRLNGYNFETLDYTVAENFSQYLFNFIKTSNPNSDELTEWPSISRANKYLIIDTLMHLGNTASFEEKFLLFDKIHTK